MWFAKLCHDFHTNTLAQIVTTSSLMQPSMSKGNNNSPNYIFSCIRVFADMPFRNLHPYEALLPTSHHLICSSAFLYPANITQLCEHMHIHVLVKQKLLYIKGITVLEIICIQPLFQPLYLSASLILHMVPCFHHDNVDFTVHVIKSFRSYLLSNRL